jgi:hypothetical protein
MKITSATPVLFVDRVEPTRDFFKRLGFKVSVEVKEKDGIGFAIMDREGVQVMVETRDNAREAAKLREITKHSKAAHVFMEVDDLDEVAETLAGAEVIVDRHSTFYGADEICYREPGGHLVTFAQFKR